MEDSKRRIGTFPSRKDGWLVFVLSVTAALEVIAAVALITGGPASVWLGRVLPFLLVASALVIVWSLFGTAYRVEGTDLVIRSGPFRTRVPIASIASVAPTHSANAALALSTTRLDLCCANPEKHVLVSPKEPAAFIGALRNVKPTIHVVGEVSEPLRARRSDDCLRSTYRRLMQVFGSYSQCDDCLTTRTIGPSLVSRRSRKTASGALFGRQVNVGVAAQTRAAVSGENSP